MEKKDQRRRSLNTRIDEAIASSEDITVAGIDTSSSEEQGRGEPGQKETDAEEAAVETQEPTHTGMAAEKACFITVALPECIKQIADIKVRYNSKDLPAYNQTMKHVGRRWMLRGLLAEGLITQEQFDEASALHSEYGWERDRVREKRLKR